MLIMMFYIQGDLVRFWIILILLVFMCKFGNVLAKSTIFLPLHLGKVLDWALTDHLLGADLAPAAADYGRWTTPGQAEGLQKRYV